MIILYEFSTAPYIYSFSKSVPLDDAEPLLKPDSHLEEISQKIGQTHLTTPPSLTAHVLPTVTKLSRKMESTSFFGKAINAVGWASTKMFKGPAHVASSAAQTATWGVLKVAVGAMLAGDMEAVYLQSLGELEAMTGGQEFGRFLSMIAEPFSKAV
jgi:hypothetical protein